MVKSKKKAPAKGGRVTEQKSTGCHLCDYYRQFPYYQGVQDLHALHSTKKKPDEPFFRDPGDLDNIRRKPMGAIPAPPAGPELPSAPIVTNCPTAGERPGGKGKPFPGGENAKDAALGALKRVPIPAPSLPRVPARPVAPARTGAGRVVVIRDGKKPKIVLDGETFGLSHIFLWMGKSGWKLSDLEKWCRKLDIGVPSPNTTKSRLRAGSKGQDCYGDIPKLNKSQSSMVDEVIGKKTAQPKSKKAQKKTKRGKR